MFGLLAVRKPSFVTFSYRRLVTHLGFLTGTSFANVHSGQNPLSCSLALSYEVVAESVSTVEERFSHNLLKVSSSGDFVADFCVSNVFN